MVKCFISFRWKKCNAKFSSQISRDDRWKAIAYIRSLQEKKLVAGLNKFMKQTNFPARFASSATLMKNLLTVSVIGVIIILFGFCCANPHMDKSFANYYLLSLGVAGIVFIAFQYITNAGWSVGLRRVPEAMTNVLPVAGLVMLVVLFGIHSMYSGSTMK